MPAGQAPIDFAALLAEAARRQQNLQAAEQGQLPSIGPITPQTQQALPRPLGGSPLERLVGAAPGSTTQLPPIVQLLVGSNILETIEGPARAFSLLGSLRAVNKVDEALELVPAIRVRGRQVFQGVDHITAQKKAVQRGFLRDLGASPDIETGFVLPGKGFIPRKETIERFSIASTEDLDRLRSELRRIAVFHRRQGRTDKEILDILELSGVPARKAKNVLTEIN